MREIFQSSIRQRVSVGSGLPHTATVISVVCPWCSEKGNFTMDNRLNDPTRSAISSSGTCPGCAKVVHLWSVGSGGEGDRHYIFPDGSNYYEPTSDVSTISPALARSFESMVDSYNSKNYTATAVGARRTLEGVFKYLLPDTDRKQTLARMIEQVTSTGDIVKPLQHLSHAVRSGGNLGAHFDEEREVDEEMARMLVSLVDYLISYLHILPKQIEQLETAITEK
jgi:hypothetical protein